MKNFNWQIKTKMYFGKGEIEKLNSLTNKHQRILLVYGKNSIKKYGIYDEVIKQLKGKEVFELAGIDPNPRLESVEEGVRICRENKVDAIVAVGGGSVIDCSKMIGAGFYYEGDDLWQTVINPKIITNSLPLYVVLTLAATGSETNNSAVITNFKTNEKLGSHHEALYPTAAIMDPSYLMTLPKEQVAAGTVDTMSHVFESYFKKEDDCYLVDAFAEEILKCMIKYAPEVLKNPQDYSAQANFMLASSMALNGITELGKSGRWSCHAMGHALSAYYDITHGVSLAIVTPRWMEHILSDKTVDRFYKYGCNVWGLSGDKESVAKEAIKLTYDFFVSLDVPMTLTELGIDSENFINMAERAVRIGGLANAYVSLSVDDVVTIYQNSL